MNDDINELYEKRLVKMGFTEEQSKLFTDEFKIEALTGDIFINNFPRQFKDKLMEASIKTNFPITCQNGRYINPLAKIQYERANIDPPQDGMDLAVFGGNYSNENDDISNAWFLKMNGFLKCFYEISDYMKWFENKCDEIINK